MKYLTYLLSFLFFASCSLESIELIDSKIEKYLDRYAYELGLEERNESESAHAEHKEKDWEKYALEICEIIYETTENRISDIKRCRNWSCIQDFEEESDEDETAEDLINEVEREAGRYLSDSAWKEFDYFVEDLEGLDFLEDFEDELEDIFSEECNLNINLSSSSSINSINQSEDYICFLEESFLFINSIVEKECSDF